VGLSQPATSAALARLRLLFGDALFVRAAPA
jgi:DNA-binding transcriptional LysR family regulator